MKRVLLPVMMLVCLFSLFARPTLVVSAKGETEGYALMTGVVERVAEHSLLSRMGGEGVLQATISDLLEEKPNALSATVHFRYGEGELQLCLSAEAKDYKNLQKVLEKKLSSMLLYDGRTLLEKNDALVIGYTYDYGYATLSSLHKGDRYKGIDALGNRWGTAVVQQTFAEENPLSLLVGTSGKELLPGMELEKQAGKEVVLFLSKELKGSGHLGLEGLYSQEVGLYPFALILGGGFDLTSQLSNSTVYAQAGLAVNLPLSMVFSLHSGFWRNSSFRMRGTLGLGYSFADSLLFLGSDAVFSYRYQIDGWGLDIGLGGKHWASETHTYSSGLFMQLGLAYTW